MTSAQTSEGLEDAQVSYGFGFYAEEKTLDGKLYDLSVKLAKKPEWNAPRCVIASTIWR